MLSWASLPHTDSNTRATQAMYFSELYKLLLKIKQTGCGSEAQVRTWGLHVASDMGAMNATTSHAISREIVSKL